MTGEIAVNDETDEGLISKVHKQLIQLNIKKYNAGKNQAEDLNDLFRRRHTDGQYAYEKMLNVTNQQGNANQSLN